ncbi:MAG: prolyl oligopeptidase family serine peptidase [Clostridia bacterium]|nr:prolyl oligopeptidase family serine peptidase [Clostridia bacterium]
MNRPIVCHADSKLATALAGGWNDLVFPAENGILLKYQLYIPENFDRAKNYPLIFYMHSAGVRCDDNSQIYTGEAKFLRNLETGDYKDGCLVLSPCCPKTDKWVDVDRWNCLEFDADKLPQSRYMAAAVELFADVCAHLPVDKNRLYLYGMSMGGFAVWDLLARYPHTFAAAAIAAGCGSPRAAKDMTDVAIWIFHGTKDGAVPYESALRMAQALTDAGKTDFRLTSFEGAGHGIWALTADTAGLYDWMFAQKRSR